MIITYKALHCITFEPFLQQKKITLLWLKNKPKLANPCYSAKYRLSEKQQIIVSKIYDI